jgi:hypothetical protein
MKPWVQTLVSLKREREKETSTNIEGIRDSGVVFYFKKHGE